MTTQTLVQLTSVDFGPTAALEHNTPANASSECLFSFIPVTANVFWSAGHFPENPRRRKLPPQDLNDEAELHTILLSQGNKYEAI
ncbi:MAG: hypothetical protein A3C11_02205 [Candidatus Sungbacteria bacterium RIFCSPHIGHO2_02_FULL_49_12]|uniref:Uncharacterized protein n=1 Tax=Candidatus Sungbacteria bacterium RIFCSPHIGHO2_02_FULL_49_12 TaxID=1802271 RepID=A0A1G2KLX3_9BACT|nr:MAG: hypothetical protein A3C11_02205 [Candidatus Sungbacteria bacterium RIFCSPHIGHO2_02_FULL_49_12]